MLVLYLLYFIQERRKIFLFRFFALRDKLYLYAIEGLIDEKSKTFTQLSLLINTTIAFSKHFTLKRFSELFENNTLERPDKNLDFITDLQSQPDEIKELAYDFFNDFTLLLIRNHPVLYILIKLSIEFKLLTDKISIFRAVFESYKSTADLIKQTS